MHARPAGLAIPKPALLLAVAATLGSLVVACGGDGENDPGPPVAPATADAGSRPAPSPDSAVLTVDPTPAPSPDRAANEFEYSGFQIFGDFVSAAPIEFPEHLLMVVETGCADCEGQTDALYRVWRNTGETHVEKLVDASIGGPDARITSFALHPNLGEIVVTVCTRCAGGPLIESPVEAYRSIDGGVTWRRIHEAAPGDPIVVRAVTDEGLVFSNLEGGLFYLRGAAIEPPAGATQLLPDSSRAGELRWLAGDGSSVVDADGNTIARVEPGSLIDTVVQATGGPSRSLVGWALGYVSGPFEGWAVTRPGPDGRLAGFRLDTAVSPVTVLEDGSAFGTLPTQEGAGGGAIGLIDVATGRLTPLHGALVQAPFGDGSTPPGRNELQGVVAGPFLRVSSGANCLPIRESTEVRSREVTCAAEGTLLHSSHSTVTVGGQEWSRVRLLDGREGYAVSSFLNAD